LEPDKNLQIRDPRADELARQLAARRNITMSEAVIGALEAELRRIAAETPLSERLAAIADQLAAIAQAGGRDITKDEIDEMWGHP